MDEFIWMAKIKSNGMTLPEMAQWRDKELIQHFKSPFEKGNVSCYCAFNVNQLAIVMEMQGLNGRELTAPFASHQTPQTVLVQQALAQLTFEKRQQGTSNPDRAHILYSVAFDVPDQWSDEFDAWYEKEHIPMIYECEHWAMTKRYRIIQKDTASSTGSTHLALHYLTDAAGLDAPELKAARLTPWRNQWVQQPWFNNSEKLIYFRQRMTP